MKSLTPCAYLLLFSIATLSGSSDCNALEQVQRYRIVSELSGGLTPNLSGEFDLVRYYAMDAMPSDQPTSVVFANTRFSREPFSFIGQLEGRNFANGVWTPQDTIPLNGVAVPVEESYIHVQDIELTGYRTWIDLKIGENALWLSTFLEERPGGSVQPPNNGIGPEFFAVAVPEPTTVATAITAIMLTLKSRRLRKM